MITIRIDPETDDELLAAFDWYEARCRGLGQEFTDAVEEAMARLTALPEASTPSPASPPTFPRDGSLAAWRPRRARRASFGAPGPAGVARLGQGTRSAIFTVEASISNGAEVSFPGHMVVREDEDLRQIARTCAVMDGLIAAVPIVVDTIE